MRSMLYNNHKGVVMNTQQIELVKVYCRIGDNTDSTKYTAFMESEFTGNKQTCLDLFEEDKIVQSIKRNRNRYQTIPKPRKAYKTKLNEQTTRSIEKLLIDGNTLK